MILYMYIVYSPGAGADNPLDEILMSTGTSCHFGPLFQVSKKISLKSDFIHFFSWLNTIMYIAPGQGQTAPKVQKFDVNRKALSLYPFVASLKEISFKPDLIQFFSWFNTCI